MSEKIPDPTRKFEVTSQYELVNIEDLDEEERVAVLDAIAAYHQSDNPEFHAGAVAVAEDDTKVAMPNKEHGPEGHAEMLALKALYKSINVPASKRKLKFMVLAGSHPDIELVNGKKYTADTPLEEIADECAWPCGRCLKFINDYSANTKDVKFLIVTASGQVLRTSLRALYPMPHKTSSVSLEPLKEGAYSPGYDPDADPTRKIQDAL